MMKIPFSVSSFKRKGIPTFVACLLAVWALSACNPNNVYKESQGLAQFSWPKDKTLEYTVNIENPDLLYDAKLSFRHVSATPFGDFKLKAEIESPSGKKESTEIIVPVRDKETKELIGEAMGDICDTDFAFLKDYKFEKGATKIKLTHLMEKDPFMSIMEVWLFVDKQEKK